MDFNTPSYVDPMRYGDGMQWDNTNYVPTPAYHQPYSHPSEIVQLSNCPNTSSHSDAAVIAHHSSNPYCLTPVNVVPTTDAYTDWQSAGGTSLLRGYCSQGLAVNSEMQGYISSAQRSSPLPERRRAMITHSTSHGSRTRPYTQSAVESNSPKEHQPSDKKQKRAEVFQKKQIQIITAMKRLYKEAFNILRQHPREQHSSSGQNHSSTTNSFESADLLKAWMPVMNRGVSTYYLGPPWWLDDIEYTTEVGELTEEARKRILHHLICGEHSLKVSLETLKNLCKKMKAVDIHEKGIKALETAMRFHKWMLEAQDQGSE